MFFIFFIFSRNTIFGAAEQKCSAEHRLRNPALDHFTLPLLTRAMTALLSMYRRAAILVKKLTNNYSRKNTF
jgi:hypothetical protein